MWWPRCIWSDVERCTVVSIIPGRAKANHSTRVLLEGQKLVQVWGGRLQTEIVWCQALQRKCVRTENVARSVVQDVPAGFVPPGFLPRYTG